MLLIIKRKFIFLLPCMGLLFCLSCGDHSGTTNETSQAYTSIRFRIAPPDNGGGRLTRAATLNCAGLGIRFVSALVFNASGELLQSGGPWECELGEGVIDGVPSGQTARVVILCLNESENTIFRGESSDILLETETVADAGVIQTGSFIPQLVSPLSGSILDQHEGTVTLSWNELPSARYYRIRISASSDFSDNGTITETVEENLFSVDLNALATDIPYYWEVTAIDPYDNPGAASEVWTFTVTAPVTPPPPPENQKPSPAIQSPNGGKTFLYGAQILFKGTATDPEDGVLSGASLVWTSNIDGQIGTGSSFQITTLTTGTHTITLLATDSRGATATTTISVIVSLTPPPNQAPTATILSPQNDSAYPYENQEIAFSGTGRDPESVALSGAALSWSSSIDGTIGSGESFTMDSLSSGDHTITLTVTDPEGLSDEATIHLTIHPRLIPNTPPIIYITLPPQNGVFTEGDKISFSGTAIDNEDGTIAALAWTSDGDLLGYGQNLEVSTLSAGNHTITLKATDSEGATGQSSVNITVNPAQSQTSDMSGTWNYYTSDFWSEGDCSTGPSLQGTLTIAQSGNSFTLTMVGMTFSGAVVDNYYACSTTTQIQGGTQTTAIGFQRESDNAASGTSTTVATFAEYSCQWGSTIYIYR